MKKSKHKHISVVTGTRADYGILKPVMEAIDAHPRLELHLVVTGMHLLRTFGYTIDEVRRDGWRIDGRARLQGENDDVIGQSRGLGRAISKMTDIFFRINTDVVLVLGDRLEMLAAASAAAASQLTIGHIHGGDAATGIQDEAYRYAISKLAHLHFAACAGSRRRLVKLGEYPWRIYQTGSPALDDLAKIICTDNEELNRQAGFDTDEDFIIVLQHPAGETANREEKLMWETLRGCSDNQLKMLVLYPNCDPGHSGIIRMARRFCAKEKVTLLPNLPRAVFLGLLQKARLLVGNSSCGIIEAGYLNVDVINVGPRQTGRDRGKNVVDCDYGRKNVGRAVKTALASTTKRRKRCRIYGSGNSGKKIADILADIRICKDVMQKKITY